MSVGPSDWLSVVADWLGILGFIGAIVSGLYARARGNTADKAIRELKQAFARRELLPDTAIRYQQLYREMAALFGQSDDSQAIAQKVGEFRGMINSLDSFFDSSEKAMLRSAKERLTAIENDPANKTHRQNLLGDAASISVELEVIVKRVTWNSQS